MSVHTWVTGSVTLDADAVAALQQRPTWDWVREEDEGIRVQVGERTTITFEGSLHRNLGRYLGPDLTTAASAGEVRGTLTLDCQDGCHEREVLRLDEEGTWVGQSECLREDVDACLVAPGEVKLGKVHLLTLLLPVPESPTRVLSGADAPVPCGCRGWDETDGPQCRRDPELPTPLGVETDEEEPEEEDATTTRGVGGTRKGAP